MAAMTTGNWAYAVPLDETNGFAQSQRIDPPKPQETSHAPTHYKPRSTSAQRKADAWDVRSESATPDSRRAATRQSGTSTATRKRSRNALRDRVSQQNVVQPPAGPTDDSAWIHRDKLAQIEIQEMAEAGFHVRPSRRSTSVGPGVEDNKRASRSQSRNDARRPRSQEREAVEMPATPPLEEQTGQQYTSFDDFARKKRPAVQSAADDADRGFQPGVVNGIPTPEETTAEHPYRQHTLRPSTSRIPVSKIGGTSVPQQVLDRDSPLPRSRSGSNALGGNWDEMQYDRKARSNSIGSQGLLDEAEAKATPPRTSPTKENHSPPKSRLPNKSAPTSGARKASGAPANANGTARPGSSHLRKNNSSAPRPGSSSGISPPTSHNAPEGDPPWLVGVYKPDPRLPPDQQMLPTHAKRMMQDQWEKEGKTGTVYDKDFRLLNDEEVPRRLAPSPLPSPHPSPGLPVEEPKKSPLIPSHSPNGEPGSSIWPLTPQSDGSLRPSTSGGYKITPTINAPPSIHRRSQSPVKTPAASPLSPNNPTPRLPDLDEKQEAKPKKACCCVMM